MIMELSLLVGLLAVASNPSPYYAALGLVGGSGIGCLMLAKGGVSFLSLVLFLVYLGGMMVVFAYCAALVAEPYPEAWGSRVVMIYLGVYNFLLLVVWVVQKHGEVKVVVFEGGSEAVNSEWWGVGDVLCHGGWVLLLGGWALLLVLIVVLEVVRGNWGGALRAV
uniref:NADH-ubiquinone oxidoreductase chain 6 n=1 Tax=Glandirana tientaiensis TaxID=121168 RepID=A0A0U1XFH9_9NEOB|nr:NADH dehydrogenase subunit 6 [Glandirana tientaiensis]AIQ78416.1 NADH dehydrogenase subunit 6 [Glandirana tientaiensis]